MVEVIPRNGNDQFGYFYETMDDILLVGQRGYRLLLGGTPSALAANRRVEIFVSKKSW
jgi:hypothetical protein